LAQDSIFSLRQQVKQKFTWGQIFNHSIQPLLFNQEKS
jgi:hypothetical protein